MKGEINNPEKHFILFGYGLFAGFVYLLPPKGKSQTEGKKEVGHD